MIAFKHLSGSYVSSLHLHVTLVVDLAGGLPAASDRSIGLAQLNVDAIQRIDPPIISHLKRSNFGAARPPLNEQSLVIAAP
jgi:hypothetical protein